MKHHLAAAIAVCGMSLLLAVVAHAQSPVAKPAPELKDWDFLIGDWTFVGTAKDTPTEAEYKVEWKQHGSRILGGFFMQADTIWKGNGTEHRWREILSFDPVKKVHTFCGFGSGGSTWIATATFENGTSVQMNGTSTTARGKIIRWRNTYVISADGLSLSGTQEMEQDDVRWTSVVFHGNPKTVSHALS
jgi:hypothetical protein